MRPLVVPLLALSLSVVALGRAVLPGRAGDAARPAEPDALDMASAEVVVVTGAGGEALRARGARLDTRDPGAVLLDDVRGTFPLAAGGEARAVAATARWTAGALALGPGQVDAGDGALVPCREARWTPGRLDVALTSGGRRVVRLRR